MSFFGLIRALGAPRVIRPRVVSTMCLPHRLPIVCTEVILSDDDLRVPRYRYRPANDLGA